MPFLPPICHPQQTVFHLPTSVDIGNHRRFCQAYPVYREQEPVPEPIHCYESTHKQHTIREGKRYTVGAREFDNSILRLDRNFLTANSRKQYPARLCRINYQILPRPPAHGGRTRYFQLMRNECLPIERLNRISVLFLPRIQHGRALFVGFCPICVDELGVLAKPKSTNGNSAIQRQTPYSWTPCQWYTYPVTVSLCRPVCSGFTSVGNHRPLKLLAFYVGKVWCWQYSLQRG